MNTDDRIAKLKFSTLYPLYIQKIERKGRTIPELNSVIQWLTGFEESDLKKLVEEEVSMQVFFQRAKLNGNASSVKGLICGIRIESIDNELTRKARILDKLVDELAKGKKLEKIFRIS